jgi:FAD/FMN-containing dehydrogenase
MGNAVKGAAEALESDFAGRVVGATDDDYDEVRKVWNGDIDRRPGLIAQCSGPADVVAAVRVARANSLPASVRGGGHAVAGHALCDGGIVIDLSTMTGARVDAAARTIRVQGGCLNSHVDRESQAYGMGVTGGVVSHTGVAGLTLGGGIGHLMRKFGLTIDSLLSCDVVTADGESLVASESENADLFWGLRGGGGNFGIVTSFDFRLQPLDPSMLCGMVAWPMEDAEDVLGLLRDTAAGAPDELGLLANLRLAPPLPAVPEAYHGKPIIALVLCYAGAVGEAEKVMRPLRDFKSAAFDTISPKSYVAHQKLFDAALPHGRHYYWKSHKLPPLTNNAISIIVDKASEITSPLSAVPIFTQGGAVARVPDEATAFAHRGAAHDINVVASWMPDSDEADRHVAWVRDFFTALEPESVGVYVNFTSDDDESRVREAAYGGEKWKRLVALKDEYDPDNFFRLNANVPPSG